MSTHVAAVSSSPVVPAEEEDEVPLDREGLRSFLRRTGRASARMPGQTALVFLAFLIGSAFIVGLPMALKYLIDHAILQGDWATLVRVSVVLGVGVALAAVAGVGRDYLWAKFSTSVLNEIRSELFERLLTLSMDFFMRTQIAEMAARFSTDLASIERGLEDAPTWAFEPFLDTVGALVLMLVLDWRLSLVALLVVPFGFFAPRLVAPRAASASYEKKTHEAGLMTVIGEVLTAHSVVRAFGLEAFAIHAFRNRMASLTSSSVRTALLGSLLHRSVDTSMLVLQVVVLAVGAVMTYDKQLSIGSLVAFMTLYHEFAWGMGYVSQYFPTLLQAAAGTRRIDELLREAPRVSDEEGSQELLSFDSEIRFESIRFGYEPEHTNLMDLSLQIQAGSSVAFVGPSGSGKSTVLNLLMRFYDPSAGRVLLDGHDVRRVTQSSLRGCFGVVFQDTILFDTSIRENIRLGKLNATDQEVEDAARAAEMHDLILALPAGYETTVGERGARLSGGQRQRIAIARAILRNPKILVLDEATSALDAEAESAISKTLSRVSRGRTVISVSHRLALVADFDRIFVLSEGRLVDEGSHGELVSRGGTYASLWAKQSGVSFNREEQRAAITPARLGEIPVFRSLDGKQRELITSLLATERMLAGREVFREGDHGDKLYIIARGRVGVFAGAGGAEVLRAVLEQGDYFGEIALLENTPRTASIRAQTDCVFLTLTRDAFYKLLENVPDLRSNFEKVAKDRLESSAIPATAI